MSRPSLNILATSSNPDGLFPFKPRNLENNPHILNPFFKSVQCRRDNTLHLLLLKPNQHLRAPLHPPGPATLARRPRRAKHPHPTRTIQRHRPLPLLRARAPLHPSPPNRKQRPPNPPPPRLPTTFPLPLPTAHCLLPPNQARNRSLHAHHVLNLAIPRHALHSRHHQPPCTIRRVPPGRNANQHALPNDRHHPVDAAHRQGERHRHAGDCVCAGC
ncbi:hypothetical protein B0T19DRAFT_427477 [Cercophora scortea]|uniref:Uncharacterized protein n=1 Tax=Cercophora scortea TaxID=314031 RepID=A0AAE0IFC0_9PEZI|nr:hypothetical protein B0T19DRAFT_427477 [Cercophora scortea]